ncbi:MAG: alpha/beta fold hydrolase [Hyphomicrobium sp.]|nr:alpha/beta fold hydrolase [Hyphomicrobium sp.]
MGRNLDWSIDGPNWPNGRFSRFVSASGFRWHVQVTGSGPVLLLVHGTGASAHSWRQLMPLLSARFTVVVPDLPGHGFTEKPRDDVLTLPGMAGALADLMQSLDLDPAIVVGHSAGAAVLIRATLDGGISPRMIISLNGALLPFQGFAGQVFKPLAKLLVLQPFVAPLFAWRAGERRAVERLLAGTGSQPSAEDVDLYAQLFQSPRHVSATLAMMANWDLESLAKDLVKLQAPIVLVAGTADKAIAPANATRVQRLAPHAAVELLEGLGHLAHEQRPDLTAALILRNAAAANIF